MSKFYKKRHFWILVIPLMILFTAFMTYPLIYNIVYSLTNMHGVAEVEFTGLKNYKRLIEDPYFKYCIKNTFIIVFVLLVTILPSSFFTAYVLNRNNKLNNTCKSIIFTPYVISAALTALIWQFILNPSTGLINMALEAVGLESWKQQWINGPKLSPYMFGLMGAWAGLGFYVTLWNAGIRSISTDVLEAGLIDGTTRWQQVRYLILPMLKDTTGAITLFIVTGGLKTFEYVDILTGGGPLYKSETIVSYMYTQIFTNTQYGYGMTIAVVECVIALAATFIVRKLINGKND